MGRPPTITRTGLLETARGVFSRKGFAATTLADIAAELGVTPAAILRHTGSKETLFAESMTLHLHEAPPFFGLLQQPGADQQPREVLPRFATELVHFLESRLGDIMAVAMHMNAALPDVIGASLGDKPTTVPVRALNGLQAYFRRCMKAGTMREAPPRAVALAFLGSLQAYVIFHQVLRVASPRMDLERYIEALLVTWTDGAFVAPRRKSTGGRRGKAAPGR